MLRFPTSFVFIIYLNDKVHSRKMGGKFLHFWNKRYRGAEIRPQNSQKGLIKFVKAEKVYNFSFTDP